MTPEFPAHFTYGEITTTSVHNHPNIPNETQLGSLFQTALNMERVRTLLGDHPIHVNSGFRSPEINRAVGGVVGSAHTFGYAVDFICPGFGSPLEVCRKLSTHLTELGVDQLIEEGTWVHLSFAPSRRREVLTKNGDHYRVGLG